MLRTHITEAKSAATIRQAEDEKKIAELTATLRRAYEENVEFEGQLGLLRTTSEKRIADLEAQVTDGMRCEGTNFPYTVTPCPSTCYANTRYTNP